MNKEELAQPEVQGDDLNFDAHEFDGLRPHIETVDTLIARVDRFVRENPLLCVGIALAAGCAVGGLLRRNGHSSSEETCQTPE